MRLATYPGPQTRAKPRVEAVIQTMEYRHFTSVEPTLPMRHLSQAFSSPLFSSLACAGALAAAVLLSPEAQAGGLDACGDVFVAGDAECEVLVEGGCKAECEPFAFNASCAAEGSLECSGGCNIEAEVECTGSCQASCEAECEVDPGAFDCRASCEGNCASNCQAQCAGSEDGAECRASCEATCSFECGAACDIDAPQADCVAQCEGCCGGECRAEINMGCQLDCQADFYVDCKADLQGGCEAQCEAPEGALFCDGQFIEVSASAFDNCVAALQDILDIDVSFEAEASASASLSCAVEDEPARGGAAWMGLGLICLAALRLRKD